MAGFEDLIRGAIAKQGDPTRERRAAIYKSSQQALERMLAQNTTLSETAVALQRQRLESAIEEIEAEYSVNDTPLIEVGEPVDVAPPVSTGPSGNPAPMPTLKESEPSQQYAVEPGPRSLATPVAATPEIAIPDATVEVLATSDAPPVEERTARFGAVSADSLPDEPAPVEYPESYSGDVLQEKKSHAKLLLWTIILVGIAVAIWWAITFGPDFMKAKLGGSVPNPSQTIESGSFIPENTDGWIVAFNPADDAANIESAGRGTADLFRDGNSNFVRLTSRAGSPRNNLLIRVPRGVMGSLRAKSVTFEVMLRNPEDIAHEFAVYCEFGDMGDCGRKRFSASNKVEAFIFDVTVKDAPLARDEDAHLALNTDLAGEGRALDIYSVWVRIGG